MSKVERNIPKPTLTDEVRVELDQAMADGMFRLTENPNGGPSIMSIAMSVVIASSTLRDRVTLWPDINPQTGGVIIDIPGVRVREETLHWVREKTGWEPARHEEWDSFRMRNQDLKHNVPR